MYNVTARTLLYKPYIHYNNYYNPDKTSYKIYFYIYETKYVNNWSVSEKGYDNFSCNFRSKNKITSGEQQTWINGNTNSM